MSRLLPLAALSLIAACAAPDDTPSSVVSSLNVAFDEASAEFDVPRDLLVAISYSQTRFQDPEGLLDGDHAHGMAAHGVMALPEAEGGHGPDLDRAAEQLGLSPWEVARMADANVRGAAAELRGQADVWQAEYGLPLDRVDDWAEVIGWYSGSDSGALQRSFARQVYSHLESGLLTQGPSGEWFFIEPRELDIPALHLESITTGGDYEGAAAYVQAHSSNYSNDNRGPSDIDRVLVHTAQGSYAGTISWFTNSRANVATHYVLRSSDGEVTQTLMEEDRGWHAGHSGTNSRSVAIELEGYISQPGTWYTDAMYRSLADLIRDIGQRQSIPMDREHVIGHFEVPGCSGGGGGGRSCHTDPGSGFDWDRLMGLINGGSGGTDSGGNDSGGSDSGGSDSGGSDSGGNDSGGQSAVGTADLVGFVRADSIYNTDGAIEGAQLRLSSGEVVATNADGFFAFRGVPAGAASIEVSAGGYGAAGDSLELYEGHTNWNSVALVAESGSGSTVTTPGVPGGSSPTGWVSEGASSVTMSWANTGAPADSYEVKIYWYDGDDWQYYYAYNSTSESKTFYPAVDDTYYAWAVRGVNGYGGGEWTALNYFWFGD